MSLQDVTSELLHDPKAADKLKLADDYMLQQKRFGRRFILPKEHSILSPIIERYSKNLDKFVAYVKQVRDAAPARGAGYIALHELYRTLEVRLVQQQRRERANRALAWLAKHYPRLDADQRQRWMRKVEQKWGQRRMAVMEAARRKTHRDRLSTEEREELLKDFWEEIDNEIRTGDLPNP
jgi:hypothetical protein